MNKIEVDIYGDATNATVVKLPWRRFPGIVIQGDSLEILNSTAEQISKALAKGQIESASEYVSEIRLLLSGYKNAYEAAMKNAGLKLPY